MVEILGMLEGQVHEEFLDVRQALIEPVVDRMLGDRERLGIAVVHARGAPKHVARQLVEQD